MESLNPIINYIEFLSSEQNIVVSIHIHKSPVPVGFHFLTKHNSHIHPYCSYIKKIKEATWDCLKCQRKSLEKCKAEGNFSGICHAGVFEYVYPIRVQDEIIGILSAGGYKAENFEKYRTKISNKYDLDSNTLTALYNGLNGNLPSQKTVDTLIIPLLSMIELFFSKQGLGTNAKRTLPNRIIEYCRYNYNKKITTETICEQFFCSRSYVAHSFKKETGKSLPEYVNGLRIESAKNMLKNSNISIAEIAEVVGFEDRSYFSKCFTKETGISPKKWREKYDKGENER